MSSGASRVSLHGRAFTVRRTQGKETRQWLLISSTHHRGRGLTHASERRPGRVLGLTSPAACMVSADSLIVTTADA
jgi:hypothetical protein